MTISGPVLTRRPNYLGMDRPTLAALYKTHFGLVRRVVYRFGVPERDQDDAMQEAWIAINRALPGFDPSRPVEPWMFVVAWRAVRDARAHKGPLREVPVSTDELDLVAHDDDEPGRGSVLGDAALVSKLLSEVDEPFRVVLVMHDLEELPMAEVALALDVPLETARKRRRTGLEQLAAAARRHEAAERRRTGAGALLPVPFDPAGFLASHRDEVPPAPESVQDRVWRAVQDRLAADVRPPLRPSGAPSRLAASVAPHAPAFLAGTFLAGAATGAAIAYALLHHRPPVEAPAQRVEPTALLASAAPVQQPSTPPAPPPPPGVGAGAEPLAAGARPQALAEPLASSATTSAPSIASERQLLLAARVDVQHAAAADDPALAESYLEAALGRLDEHARQYPHGDMSADREALRAQVRAQMRTLAR
jgi:RNA polymerase sigma-70 factor (ECF subfamily)